MKSTSLSSSEKMLQFNIELDRYLCNRKQCIRTYHSNVTRLFDKFFANINKMCGENETLTIFGSFTLRDKITVINKLKKELSGDSTIKYDEIDIDAARDSDLGRILKLYDDILPKNFKNAELKYQQEMENRILERDFSLRR